LELVSYVEWGSSVTNQRPVEALHFVEAVEQLGIFETQDQYSQEPHLSKIKNLKKKRIYLLNVILSK